MDKLKNGGQQNLALDSTALQRLKQDTLSRLHQAKKSVQVLVSLSNERDRNSPRVIVSIKNSGEMRGKSRMLSESELKELVDSKQIVANETHQIIHSSGE